MGMKEEIITDLATELRITEGDKFNEDLLRSKVNGAYRECQSIKGYTASYTEAMIERDMQNYYSQIRAVSLFDYNQIGSEFQSQYSQDGVSIHYTERNKLWYGVLPLAKRG